MPKATTHTKRSENAETVAKTLTAATAPDPDSEGTKPATASERTHSGRFVPDNGQWMKMYRELQRFRRENHHCIVLRNHPTLGNWSNRQRTLYRSGRLAKDRQEKLNALGFSWDRDAERWDLRFLELLEYKELFGSCRVPRRYRDNMPLARWVECQRNYYNNDRSKISQERVDKLNSIGFVWCDNRQTDWEVRFQQLLKFKQQHGHCLVPQKYPPNPSLGNWVMSQRYHYRKGHNRLTKEKIAKLNAVGFTWEAINRQHQFLMVQNSMENVEANQESNEDSKTPAKMGK